MLFFTSASKELIAQVKTHKPALRREFGLECPLLQI